MSSSQLDSNLAAALDLLRMGGILPVERRELVNGIQVRLSDGIRRCRFNFYYSSHKGFSIVQAGGNPELRTRIQQILEGREVNIPEEASRIGSDEAGKGDYLGPLTAAAVFGDEVSTARLIEMGVTDSKRLRDKTIRNLAGRIRSMNPASSFVVSVPPEEYNAEFRRLKAIGRNSLDLLALCHARAIGELFRRGFAPQLVVIDRFCPPKRIRHLLPAGSYVLDMPVQGESDPVVAAASILARDAYLEGLDRISEKLGIRAVPGAGSPTDAVARCFVEEYGENILETVAKLHFKNTCKVLNSPT